MALPLRGLVVRPSNRSNSMTKYEAATVRRAIRILEARCSYLGGEPITSPGISKQLAFAHLAGKQDEHFAAAFLDNRHRLLAFETLFRGTVDGASVHARVVVRRALELNAAALLLAHNHPSGCTEPSQADQRITQRLKDALALIDVRVLDHLVVGAQLDDTVSFAERGLF
jgi:DNA repair protein RadC